MAKRASPGVGRGIGDNSMPTHDDIRAALAMEMIIAEQVKALNEKKKRVRKKIEGMGIPLIELDWLKKQDGKTASELEAEFRVRFHLMGAVFDDLYEQFDIFAPKAEAPARRAAYFHQGLMAGLKGEDMVAPPGLVGDALQQMTKGHQEGAARRKAAGAILLEALDPDNAGKVVDGTPDAVAARAAKDFSEDQKAEGHADPLVVDGVKYDTMRQANAARKRTPVVMAITEAEANAALKTKADADLDAAIRVQNEMQAARAPATAVVEAATKILAENPGERIAGFAGPDDAEDPNTNDSFAADLEAAQPTRQLPMPNWDHYDDDPDNWFAVQKAEARRWAESLPAGYVPLTTHVGAGAFLRAFWAEPKAAAPVEHDTADAPGNHPPPAQSSVEEVDYDAVEAEAERLRKSAFMAGDSKGAASAEAQKRRARLTPRKAKA